jgi:pyruvate dehydrogenase E2 component (dihydrolipoamide acetyltransferase)
MPTNVLMPKTGADETVGKLVRWLKKEGDVVSRGDIVAEIETDKVNMEVEAFGAGTLYRILVKEGESSDVGKPIALLLKEGEQPPADAPASGQAAATAAPSETPAKQASAQTAPPDVPVAQTPAAPVAVPAAPAVATAEPTHSEADGAGGRIKASPLARKIAQEHNLDLRMIAGRGPGGRVVRDDVEAAIQAGGVTISAAPTAASVAPVVEAPASEPEPAAAAASGEKALTRIQLTAARRLTESKQNAPHFYLTLEVDMAEALKLRGSLNEQAQGTVKVSVNDLVIKACAWALQQHPYLNSTYRDGKLLLHDRINISVAIALEEGLVSPVIPDVDRKSLGQIARDSKAMIARAKAGKLRPEDYADGTFTVSNLGMFDIDTFIAIINPPQAGILAVGAVHEVPVVRDGQLAIGQIMKVTLSADHRATDGASGARFLLDVRRALEKPLLMAL